MAKVFPAALLYLVNTVLQWWQSANRKSANFQTNNFCQICGPSANVAFCGCTICGSYIFSDLRIRNLRTQLFFCGLPQIHTSPYIYKLKMLSFNIQDDFRYSFELHGISQSKYTYVGKKNITVEANQCGSIRNITFFQIPR